MMTSTSNTQQAIQPRGASKQPKWYRLYFVLAAFDILTVCASLAMNHRLVSMYKSSVETNRVWADRLAAYAHLNSLAAQANAPGNDVFESRDVDETSARLDAKLADFSSALTNARQELRRNLTSDTASTLLPHLDNAEAAMLTHVAEARRIFGYVRAQDMKSAGQRMTAMDHAFYAVTKALAFLSRDVQDLQQEELKTQASVAASIRRIEYLIAGLIAIMVLLAALYGRRLIIRANIDGQLQDLAREAQENATRAEQHSQALAEALGHIEMQKFAMDEHSIVTVTDPSGKITYANDKCCQVSQYSREELIGKDHRIINSGHHPRAFFAELWKTITAGEVWHGEICNRTKDGSLYWVDTTIVPFRDDEGRIAQYIAIRTDITESKLAEVEMISAKEAAESANVAKSEFLANMSHEIRTPMTAILGFTENMLDVDQTKSQREKCIHTIQRNGDNLLAIINDILDLSKIEAGKMTVEHSDCQPCRVIAEVASLMRVRADAKRLSFDIDYTGAIPESIQSDPTRLRQILINLIGNAIKFTDTGSVRLFTRFVDDGDEPSLQFDVIDTGRGMTDEQKAKLFQPFMQADTSTSRKFGGTGLGLTISKRFAKLLGGDITVESKPSQGSMFRIIVTTGPLDGVKMLDDPMSATVVANEPTTVTHAPHSDLRGCRILLAEDGPDNQRLIAFILKKAGADVTVKENGKLALDTALAARDQGNPFDVILMDMQMPVMDGYEATGLLRQKGYTGPIIALTAHAMASDREKCVQAGCDDFATKPINRVTLIEAIQAYYRKKNGNVPLDANAPETRVNDLVDDDMVELSRGA